MRPLSRYGTRPTNLARWLPAVVASLAAALTACGGSGGSQAAPPPQKKTLTVLAAASLTEPFHELAAQYTAQHPDVDVKFDFEGSSTLVQQIKQGRKADVFASADTKNMDKVAQAGLGADRPQTFATNRLTIAVPPGKADGIHSFADLAAPGRKVVVCAQQVPCGSATQEVERATGVRLQPVSEENDVKSVLHKVTAGEADAGLVYVSDAKSAGDSVQAVDFPEAQQAVNTYPEVVLKDAPQPQLAADWTAFAQGPAGKDALSRHGFGTP